MSASVSTLSELSRPDHIAGSGATEQAYDLTRRRVITYKCDWDEWLNQLTGELEQEERFYDEIKYREGVRNQLYYEGNFFFHFSEETGEVRDLPHTDVDPFFPHNWFRYFTDLSVAAAMEASPDIIIDPTRNDDHNIHAARAARDLADYLERELITEEFRLETEKTRQLYGGVWWYSYWSLDAGRLFAQRPIYQQSQQKIGSDAFSCNCGEMGPIESLYPTIMGDACPSCLRVTQLQIHQSPEITVNAIAGYEDIPIGFPAVECVSPLQMKGDRRGHYMKGQYLRRKRLVDRDVVAEKITWWDSTRGGSAGDDQGIRAEEIARRPYAAGGSNQSSIGSYGRDKNDVVVDQWWLQPAKYAHVQFDRDVTFIGQETTPVPAFTPLGKVFSNGLYALKVGNHWLDHNKEDFRKKWVYIPYIYLPNKSDGDSLKDMCEPQREIIHMRSLLYLYLLARSGGAPTIIKSPLSETDYDGSPNSIVRLSQGAPDPKELFFQPQFPPADPNLTAYSSQMTGEMQVMSQTVSPTTTGDPNAQEMGGTNTARGMMIMNAKAQGLQGPKLMPLAFAQARAVEQWIDLYRENVQDDIPIPLKGKTGTPEWKMLKSSDLEGDFMAYPRAGSWIPRPREERQAALQNAFSVFGQILMNPDPSLASLKEEIKEAYQLEFSSDEFETETREAMLRIDKMQELIPQSIDLAMQLTQMGMIQPDPQTGEQQDPTQIIGQILAQMVPPDQDLDEPPVIPIFLKYYKDWLQSDEGKEAPKELQAGVRALRKMYQAIMQQAEQAQIKAMQDQQNQMKDAQTQQERQKIQAQSALKNQDHSNRMQEKTQQHNLDEHKRSSESDNRIREEIARKALEAATAEGQELPVYGAAQIPKLSDLPAQPLF